MSETLIITQEGLNLLQAGDVELTGLKLEMSGEKLPAQKCTGSLSAFSGLFVNDTVSSKGPFTLLNVFGRQKGSMGDSITFAQCPLSGDSRITIPAGESKTIRCVFQFTNDDPEYKAEFPTDSETSVWAEKIGTPNGNSGVGSNDRPIFINGSGEAEECSGINIDSVTTQNLAATNGHLGSIQALDWAVSGMHQVMGIDPQSDIPALSFSLPDAEKPSPDYNCVGVGIHLTIVSGGSADFTFYLRPNSPTNTAKMSDLFPEYGSETEDVIYYVQDSLAPYGVYCTTSSPNHPELTTVLFKPNEFVLAATAVAYAWSRSPRTFITEYLGVGELHLPNTNDDIIRGANENEVTYANPSSKYLVVTPQQIKEMIDTALREHGVITD